MIRKSKREVPDLEERIRQLETQYKTKYSFKQIQAIDYGLSIDVPVELYADPKYSHEQMYELFDALNQGIDPTVFQDPRFDAKQMHEIMQGMIDGVDVSKYARHDIDGRSMTWIRLALQKEIDVDQYPEFWQGATGAQRKYLELNNKILQKSGDKRCFIKVNRYRREEYYMEVSIDDDTDVLSAMHALNAEKIEKVQHLKIELLKNQIFPLTNHPLKPTGNVETYLELSPIKDS
ncbi:hypothetical protein [Eubacterium callanderi]|uniref:hypothetical protein n=1 Tax=Eubacterium callanderi TaxID=53442 RepID=UPI0026716457|nr:hypothetical protein [Eubacterium callanderi]